MDYRDVNFGMKVVPHSKTAQGRKLGLDKSVVWNCAKAIKQPYLYVIHIPADGNYKEFVLHFSNEDNPSGGDYFLANDFEPYI